MNCEPSYNTCSVAEPSSSEHDWHSQQDMSHFAELFSAFMGLGTHGTCFALHCSPRYGMSCWSASRK